MAEHAHMQGGVLREMDARHSGLRALGRENLTAVESRIAAGATLMEISEFIQQELGFYRDVKPGTLQKQIQRYRQDIMNPRLLHAVESSAKTKETALAKLKDNLNVLQEVQELAVMQKLRIEKGLKRENEMPLLFTWMHKEILALDKVLSSVATIQMDLGILSRVPRKHIIADVSDLQRMAKEGHERSVVDLEEYRTAISEFQDMVRSLEGEFEDVSEDEGQEATDPLAQGDEPE